MPLKRKSIFVTPFSSQKTTDTEKRLSNPKQTQTKTPAGTFLFPVSSSKVEKIQHVTPMTKNMIKQGICRVVESFPHGADPNSPTWTFLAISQTTSIGDQIDEKSQTDEEQSAEGKANFYQRIVLINFSWVCNSNANQFSSVTARARALLWFWGISRDMTQKVIANKS